MSDAPPPPVVPSPEPSVLERIEHVQHWWREPVAGLFAVTIAAWDAWHYGRDAGFTSSLDEILLLTGIALIAGIRNLFGEKQAKPETPKAE